MSDFEPIPASDAIAEIESQPRRRVSVEIVLSPMRPDGPAVAPVPLMQALNDLADSLGARIEAYSLRNW